MKKSNYPILGLLTLTACLPAQNLDYKNLRQNVYQNPKPVILKIGTFTDKRREHPNAALFLDPQYGGDGLCRNDADSYKSMDIPATVAAAFSEHLRYRQAFSGVLGPQDKGPADFELNGELFAFFGEQGQSTRQNISSQLGAVGALTGAGTGSTAKIEIVFRNLTLLNKKNGKNQKLGPVEYKFLGDLAIDSRCFYIFRHMEDHMTLAFNLLEGELLKNIK